MRIKDARQVFANIGASLKVTYIPAGLEYRLSPEDLRTYPLPILLSRNATCEVAVAQSYRDKFQLSVEALPGVNDSLFVELGWGTGDYVRYVCRKLNGGVNTACIPDMDRPAALDWARDMCAASKMQHASRKKRRKNLEPLSFECAKAAASIRTEKQYTAYLRLFEACRKAKFMENMERESRYFQSVTTPGQGVSGYPVIPSYGNQRTNTYTCALLRMAARYERWVESPESWRPVNRNTDRCFQGLAEHLFARYPIPSFFASVWFRTSEDWIPCYIEVARGCNIRRVKALRFPLTRKMAHYVMQAPRQFTLEEAIRWGQVRGSGGGARLFQHIRHARMAPVSDRRTNVHGFWQEVVDWLVRNPMLAPREYGPLIDYLATERGRDAAFSTTGRSPLALLRAVEAWHRQLNDDYEWKPAVPEWPGHNLDWSWTQDHGNGQLTTWRCTEIVSADRLLDEGRAMHHCVYSFARECSLGTVAIFSLQANGKNVLTIEYVPGRNVVGEVRGACNRNPTAAENAVVQRWASAKRIG